MAVIYFFAPDADQDWVWLTPGSIFATTLWLLASLGFKFYIASFASYTETYGAIGGVMILMLWFYISGLVILIGAEMNAEIEHASPYGKDEGEKVPGERRKIGPARMRAWLARQRTGAKPPSAEDVKAVVGDTPPDKQPGADTPKTARRPQPVQPAPISRPLQPAGGLSYYVIGAGVLAAQLALTLKSLARTRT
jgi:membrane protein